MILKKIEMVGFKSFADKTTLEFGENFSAIVGPNGCGKSNVADAIRWVLGEQKVKDLRADTMQDVIFNGTEKRRSLSFCEVSLIFDNSSRFFNFEYDELIITRKLYRSGESEYLLNKNTCRLMDINNILYNSGLGKTGYSIIGQGKVTELVESKPESRRAMFEDAAGISKYKKDKTDSENKLVRTRQNLDRVNDILQEIERQLGPLKKQAEIAKQYLELKNQLKDLEVNTYIYQFDNAKETKARIGEKLCAIDEELALRQGEFDVISSNYAVAMEDSLSYDKKLARINNEILSLTVLIEKEAGQTRLLREKINFIQKENDRLTVDIANGELLLKSIKEQENLKQQEDANLSSQIEMLENSFNELSAKYSSISNELTFSENETGETQQKFFESLGDLSDIKANRSRFIAEKDLLSARFVKLKNQVEEYTIKKSDINNDLSSCKNSISCLKNVVEQVEKSCADLDLKIKLGQNNINEKQNELFDITTQVKVFENRKKLLLEMQADFEGYAYSVRKLLKDGEKNSFVKNNMIGTVASLINVPVKFETAIEVALGSNLQNIVTENEDNAKKLIEYLKTNSLGRATFLPKSSMKTKFLDKDKVKQEKGFLGFCNEIIECEKSVKNVIDSLLSTTTVVDNLENAVAFAKANNYAFKIVTLEGDIINPQGSLTGGSKKTNSVNLLNRNREVEDIAVAVINFEKRKSDLEKQIATLNADLETQKNLQQENVDKKNNSIIELSNNKNKIEGFEKSFVEVENELKNILLEKNTVENKIVFLANELEKSSNNSKDFSSNEDVAAIFKERQVKNANLRNQLDEISANLTTVKVEKATVLASFEAIKNEIARLDDDKSRIELQLAENGRVLAVNQQEIASFEELIKQQIQLNGDVENNNKLKELNEIKESTETKKIDIVDLLKKLDTEKTSAMEVIGNINDKKYREEMNLSKVDTDIELMQERIYEEYLLTYDDCLQFKRPDFELKAGLISTNKIKKEIVALGPVNVNAIEDCGALLDRHKELEDQSNDLLKAEADLLKIIRDLSEIMIEKFTTELNKINESFKLTFKELFGGGNARLELCDESCPLESGVEVFVQPPGKKEQNMSLYSGGEKSLTAMAIIFAILRIKPLPFCLFDEVEAALDDSNVEIVDKYLKKLSGETQFILITHKKPTMEHAKELFGVTMQEKGVSKIVSVRIEEAIKNAQDAK